MNDLAFMARCAGTNDVHAIDDIHSHSQREARDLLYEVRALIDDCSFTLTTRLSVLMIGPCMVPNNACAAGALPRHLLTVGSQGRKKSAVLSQNLPNRL